MKLPENKFKIAYSVYQSEVEEDQGDDDNHNFDISNNYNIKDSQYVNSQNNVTTIVPDSSNMLVQNNPSI